MEGFVLVAYPSLPRLARQLGFTITPKTDHPAIGNRRRRLHRA
jgi:hypothetical protein